MSWAARRRAIYMSGIVIVLALAIGIPLAHYFFSIKPTCFDGRQDGGETAVDEGGPCLKLDPRTVAPISLLWARSFPVRGGDYTAVAYIENPNAQAGVPLIHYEFYLTDTDNVLITTATGTAFIMPGGETPIVLTGIDTGNRAVVHTQFAITDATLDWERMTNPAAAVTVGNVQNANTATEPSVTGLATNGTYTDLYNVGFTVVVFDPADNAFAASDTVIPDLSPQTPTPITFTWPGAFPAQIGRIDIIPVMPPVAAPPGSSS